MCLCRFLWGVVEQRAASQPYKFAQALMHSHITSTATSAMLSHERPLHTCSAGLSRCCLLYMDACILTHVVFPHIS